MNYFIKKWGAKTLERPEWGPVGEIACFEGYFQQMWQKSLNCPYLCTVKYAVLTLSRMAFIMASSSSFCRLIATILASCSLRWRAKSIISSSVISEDDSDRCTKSPMNTSIFMGSILWSVFCHPILSLTVGSGVVLSLLFAFFSQCHRWQTRWRRLALKERAKKFCWHGLSGKMLQRSHKSWPTGYRISAFITAFTNAYVGLHCHLWCPALHPPVGLQQGCQRHPWLLHSSSSSLTKNPRKTEKQAWLHSPKQFCKKFLLH